MREQLETARTRPDAEGPEAFEVVPRRGPLRTVSTVIVLVVVALGVYSVVNNPRFRWDVVGLYLRSDVIAAGLVRTLQLTVIAMVLGLALGILLAVMRLSKTAVVSQLASFYIWVFRGTPLLVQLLFWYNLAAIYPTLSIGIPGGPQLGSWSANTLITPFVAAVLGLALNEGAYMAEIVRAGILSVEPGQVEASQSLGMKRLQTMRRIVLPQAMRVIVPPTGNQTISMLKMTSLVSVISLPELLYSAQIVYSRTFETIPLLVVASIWYLVVTTILSVGQHFIERRFSRGVSRNQPPTGNTFRRMGTTGLRRSRRMTTELKEERPA